MLLIDDVRRRFGEIPSASLETVLMRGTEARRFQAIDERTCALICDLADIRGVALPTRTIYAQ